MAHNAIEAALHHNIVLAQELLLRLRNELKRQSGDLPILAHEQATAFIGENSENSSNSSTGKRFVTRSLAETRAWGWLELASGIVQLMIERPGAGMMHFSRCWHIWRAADSSIEEAIRERIRARLWLGEAWARILSDRAGRAANATSRAALTEMRHVNAQSLLQETIAQQTLLPPAPVGSPAYQDDGQIVPYITVVMQEWAG